MNTILTTSPRNVFVHNRILLYKIRTCSRASERRIRMGNIVRMHFTRFRPQPVHSVDGGAIILRACDRKPRRTSSSSRWETRDRVSSPAKRRDRPQAVHTNLSRLIYFLHSRLFLLPPPRQPSHRHRSFVHFFSGLGSRSCPRARRARMLLDGR